MNTWWKKHITSPVINSFGRRVEKKYFSKPPIFIGGCARSGTTLLLAILSAHCSIYGIPKELDAFTEWKEHTGRFIPARIDRLYRFLLLNKIPRNVTRWCEKRPYNVKYIGEILNYFGDEARFIQIVRDPRAVCTSHHPEDPDIYWVSVERWVNDVYAGLKWRNHKQVLTIRYEDLIEETDKMINQVCEFLDEQADSEILDWFNHATVRKNKAWKGGLRDLYDESISKWKNPEHSERVAEILSHEPVIELMNDLGYS